MVKNDNFNDDEIELVHELAKLFMLKDIGKCIRLAVGFVNVKNGKISDGFWNLLFTIVYIDDDKLLFEKLSKNYNSITTKMPPVWIEKAKNNTMSTASKNIIVIDCPLKSNLQKKFENFYSVSKENNFGRIDFSKIDLENSDDDGIEVLLKMLHKLKNDFINVQLMADNVITDYFHNNKDNVSEKMWLLELEILQWKGYEDKYLDLSSEYYFKYNNYPPDYKSDFIEKINNKDYEKNHLIKNIDNKMVYLIKEEHITSQNISGNILNFLESNNETIIQFDFSKINFFDYSAAEDLLKFLTTYRNSESNYQIFIDKANVMIKIMFDMIGLKSKVQFI